MSKDDIEVADRMETWPIEKLKPYEHNPVDHSEKQKEALRDLLKRVGFRIPILAKKETGEIADGHLRLEIAEEEELEELPVIPVDDLTEEEIKVLRIGVQKTAYDGEFNQDLLQRELSELESAGIDTSLTGFDDFELDLIDVDKNFSFTPDTGTDEGQSGQEGGDELPQDAEMENGEVNEEYTCHIAFDDQARAEKFLRFIDHHKPEFPEGHFTKLIDGNEVRVE